MTNKTSDCCDYEQRVNHIKCEVSNCAYHGEENCCHAGTIEVVPQEANCECKSDTACATFRQL